MNAIATIQWFLDGTPPTTPKKSIRQIRPKTTRKITHEFTIAQLLEEANTALDSLNLAESARTKHEASNNGRFVTRDEWPDARLFGPYIMPKHQMDEYDGFFNPKVNLQIGLPDFIFIGIDRKDLIKRKKQNDANDYTF